MMNVYNEVKTEMDNIEGIQASSKCDWHEYEQKSFKFF